MKLTRRAVLRLTGTAAAALALSGCSASGSAILGSNFSAWLQQTFVHSMSRSAEERPRCGRAFCRVVLEMLLTITPTMRPLLRLASPVSGSAS